MKPESINRREKDKLPMKFRCTRVSREGFDHDMLDRFGLGHTNISTENNWDKDIFGIKFPISYVVYTLIDQGWLSPEILEKIYENEGEVSRDFLIGLGWLSYEAEELGLTEEEIGELKSNIGIISVDALRDSLKDKVQHGTQAN